MRFPIIAISALSLAMAAPAITAINEKTPLLGVAPRAGDELSKRLTIEEKVAFLSAGAAVFAAIPSIAAYISIQIKQLSNQNSCGIISGSVDGVNYQYHAATTGPKCDTTAELKTIQAAVEKGLNFMNTHSINQACFDMTHGGTWQGLLQLAAGGLTIINNKCDSVTYTLTI